MRCPAYQSCMDLCKKYNVYLEGISCPDVQNKINFFLTSNNAKFKKYYTFSLARPQLIELSSDVLFEIFNYNTSGLISKFFIRNFSKSYKEAINEKNTIDGINSEDEYKFNLKIYNLLEECILKMINDNKEEKT